MLCRNPPFFFNDAATTEIYALSLPDALPISPQKPGESDGETLDLLGRPAAVALELERRAQAIRLADERFTSRSEEHTSELQSPDHLVCRLLLEKKKNNKNNKQRMIIINHTSH